MYKTPATATVANYYNTCQLGAFASLAGKLICCCAAQGTKASIAINVVIFADDA